VVAIAKLNEAEIDDPIVSEVVAELEDAIKQENDGGKAGWLECFSLRAMSMPCHTFLHGLYIDYPVWKRTMNGMMIQFLQQMNGQNFYYYYGEPLYTDISFSDR
jgi:SP family sugar:H+ symporter-like MFS transporter